MVKHSIRLSSAEIGGLWATFIQDNMTVCLVKYFLYHNQMKIKPLGKALKTAEVYSTNIRYFTENIPCNSFTDEDIKFSAAFVL
jgi:hypothetical protein